MATKALPDPYSPAPCKLSFLPITLQACFSSRFMMAGESISAPDKAEFAGYTPDCQGRIRELPSEPSSDCRPMMTCASHPGKDAITRFTEASFTPRCCQVQCKASNPTPPVTGRNALTGSLILHYHSGHIAQALPAEHATPLDPGIRRRSVSSLSYMNSERRHRDFLCMFSSNRGTLSLAVSLSSTLKN